VSWETVNEYAEAWLSDAPFPPVDVFCDVHGEHYLADGFHRFLAAKRVHKTTIPCRVYHGTCRDAFLFACSANQTHGLRRTNADKRHMIARFLGDAEWVKWTDSRIAEQCGVSHTFVTTVRRELESDSNSAAAQVRLEPRRGADGKQYPPERRSRTHVAASQRKRPVNEGELRRKTALATLDKLTNLLKLVDIYDRHAGSLRDIEHDLSNSTA
jgi:hypothetical protein